MHETGPSDSTPEESTASDADPDSSDATVAGGWIDERPVLDAELPTAVAEHTTRLFGDPVMTVEDLVSAVRTVVDGRGITVDELCEAEAETPHCAETPDETYQFRCFYDGVVLASLVDEPVTIRTESPQRTPVEMEASPDGEIETSPPEAVVSFGVASGGSRPTDTPGPRDAYRAICPHVNAFPSRAAYDRWAQETTVATVGMPLEDGMAVAAALTAEQR